jgi:hypothetical protein
MESPCADQTLTAKLSRDPCNNVAYDGAPTYATITSHGDDIEVVIPPRSTAVFSGETGPLAKRDRHLEMITEQGRLAWQKAADYGMRSLVGTTMGR